MSDGANVTDILLIIAGVMLLTAMFVVVLVFFGHFIDWFNIFAERYIGFSISCEHCGATLFFKGRNCKSCGKPISQSLLKKYKLRMLTVSSFMSTFFALITVNILLAFILFVLGLVFWGFERHYTRIMRDFKDPKKRA